MALDHEKLVSWIALGSLALLGVKILIAEVDEILTLLTKLRRNRTDPRDLRQSNDSSSQKANL